MRSWFRPRVGRAPGRDAPAHPRVRYGVDGGEEAHKPAGHEGSAATGRSSDAASNGFDLNGRLALPSPGLTRASQPTSKFMRTTLKLAGIRPAAWKSTAEMFASVTITLHSRVKTGADHRLERSSPASEGVAFPLGRALKDTSYETTASSGVLLQVLGLVTPPPAGALNLPFCIRCR